MTLHLSHLLLCLLVFLPIGSVAQDRLSRVEKGYVEGTYLLQRPDYQHLYATTKNRVMHCNLARAETPNTDLAVCQWWVDDRAGIATLLIDYDASGRAIDDHEYPAPNQAHVDMAMAGQMSDLATTAIGIGSGLAVEANPIMAPLTNGVGWGVAWGLKAGLAAAGDKMPFADCVAWRTTASQIGWAAAAWNVVGIVVSPVLGLGAAVGAWNLSSDAASGDAVARCLEVR